jgi:hypothetical protein
VTLDDELRSRSTTTGSLVSGPPGSTDDGDHDALAVVAFFDDLPDDGVDAAGLVRRAASYTGCLVGIRTSTGTVISAGPSGSRGPGTVPEGATRLPLRRGRSSSTARASGTSGAG